MQVGHHLQPMFYLTVMEPQQKPYVKLSFIFNLPETCLQEIWAVLWIHSFTAPFLSPYLLSPTFFLPSQSPISSSFNAVLMNLFNPITFVLIALRPIFQVCIQDPNFTSLPPLISNAFPAQENNEQLSPLS